MGRRTHGPDIRANPAGIGNAASAETIAERVVIDGELGGVRRRRAIAASIDREQRGHAVRWSLQAEANDHAAAPGRASRAWDSPTRATGALQAARRAEVELRRCQTA